MWRLVVDTNIGVAAFLNPSGPAARFLVAFAARRFVVVISEPLLAEVVAVLRRFEIRGRYHVPAEDALDFVNLLRERAEVVAVTGQSYGCRDPKDDMVVETAIEGRVDCLVSDDQDIHDWAIKAILQDKGVDVLEPRPFLEFLEGL